MPGQFALFLKILNSPYFLQTLRLPFFKLYPATQIIVQKFAPG